MQIAQDDFIIHYVKAFRKRLGQICRQNGANYEITLFCLCVEDLIAKAFGELFFVTDKYYRARVVFQRFKKRLFGNHVKVVGRLVEDKKVRRGLCYDRKPDPYLFAARQFDDGL